MARSQVAEALSIHLPVLRLSSPKLTASTSLPTPGGLEIRNWRSPGSLVIWKTGKVCPVGSSPRSSVNGTSTYVPAISCQAG